jgi:uncharacterized protein YjgD (DUF1641 family)
VELNMTVADVMDLNQGGTSELVEELKALNSKLDRIETTMDAMTHRVESLEEIREDLWPMIHGASNAISRKLHELEQQGALGFITEAAKMGEHVASSFTPEDVRLLGENVVSILQTVRNLTQPEVLEVADRAAVALKDTEAHPAKRVSLWKAMRDPEIRRGMGLMMSVLREMGQEGTNKDSAALVASDAK